MDEEQAIELRNQVVQVIGLHAQSAREQLAVILFDQNEFLRISWIGRE